MRDGLRIRAVSAPWYCGVEILIAEYGHERKTAFAVAEAMTFKQYNVGQKVDPTLRITTEAAQQLMDELWHCGIRPTEGTGSAGSLAATQKHLEDMRRLVFETSGVPK